MYEYLKKLLVTVEGFGNIETVKLAEKTSYCGDRIEIEGVLADGSNFELRFERNEKAVSEDGV